eukprot:TRINITY_DN147_c0_g1_i2.p1 TRINITY_DN147_c0_g1~~TRINITY_DN147_c0_g1_i2.p1  ORF type:complete len:115 (+),score=12.84 TRINITY_DN147_c0_g1_i2:60-404(+)
MAVSQQKRELLDWRNAIKAVIANAEELNEEATLKFQAYDKDHSNFLDYNEMAACMKDFCASHGVNEIPMKQLRDGFTEIDSNRDGKITLSEFVPFVKEMLLVTIGYIDGLIDTL